MLVQDLRKATKSKRDSHWHQLNIKLQGMESLLAKWLISSERRSVLISEKS